MKRCEEEEKLYSGSICGIVFLLPMYPGSLRIDCNYIFADNSRNRTVGIVWQYSETALGKLYTGMESGAFSKVSF